MRDPPGRGYCFLSFSAPLRKHFVVVLGNFHILDPAGNSFPLEAQQPRDVCVGHLRIVEMKAVDMPPVGTGRRAVHGADETPFREDPKFDLTPVALFPQQSEKLLHAHRLRSLLMVC